MLNENDLRDFLLENPDYFQKNPDLLSLISVPHSSVSAVSLVEKQVSVLRERNVDLRHKLRDLGTLARENEQLFGDVRSLVLALVPQTSVGALEKALFKVFREQFELEYGALILFPGRATGENGVRTLPESQVMGRMSVLLGNRNAGCGPLRAEEFAFLFPGSEFAGSAAVALISNGDTPLGMLAVGSSDTGHYESSMGTLFLEFSAEVLGLLLGRLDSV